MLLNSDQIQQMNLVQNGVAGSYRTASYDLQVGKIIDHSGKVVESVEVPAQGMVRVISRERLILPSDTVANATVKTSLCDDGVLAINIGVVDPGYEGLISSTLINFGKSAFPVRTGDVFLRVTFHQITPVKATVKKSGQPDDQYLRDKIKIVLRIFSATFLNVEQTATEAAKKVVGGFWAKSLVLVSAFALIFTAGTSLATTYNAMTATRSYIQADNERSKSDLKERQKQNKDIEDLQNGIRSLKDQLKDLKDDIVKRNSQSKPKADNKS
jgi:deoxycytidine triphosphate deaminase/cell division protein FtsB